MPQLFSRSPDHSKMARFATHSPEYGKFLFKKHASSPQLSRTYWSQSDPPFWGVDIFIDVWVNLFAFVVGSWCIYFSFAPLSDSDCSHFLHHGPWLFKKSSKGNHWLFFEKRSPKGSSSPFLFPFWTANGQRSYSMPQRPIQVSISQEDQNVLELDSVIVAFGNAIAHLNTLN